MNPRSPSLFAVFTALLVARVAAVEPNLAFLGPKGSYSDEAANEYASHAHVTGTIPLKTITEIAEAVRDGRVQFGLLPFENSIGGFVGETQKDLLAARDPGWRMVGDITIPISNNLSVKPGTKASDLKKIVSHPAALKECGKWLKTNLPQLPQEEVSSTAAAAEAVSKSDGTIAAIASSAAANVYQLQILFPNIQDDHSSWTRNTTERISTRSKMSFVLPGLC
jgi:prephenate dehydratase